MAWETAFANALGVPLWLFYISIVWSLVWKGFALWKAAAVKKQKVWFVVLLIFNTLGLLEILYLFVFSKLGERKTVKKKKK